MSLAAVKVTQLLQCGCMKGAEGSASTRVQLWDVLLCVCVVNIKVASSSLNMNNKHVYIIVRSNKLRYRPDFTA